MHQNVPSSSFLIIDKTLPFVTLNGFGDVIHIVNKIYAIYNFHLILCVFVNLVYVPRFLGFALLEC